MRNRHQRVRIDAGFGVVQVAHAHHDLFQRGVASALAQAVDGGVGVRRASAQRGQRVGRGHA